MKSESAKLYQRSAELEAELAKLDAQIVQLETQAQAAIAAGKDPDEFLAKAWTARTKARATVAALKAAETQAHDLAWTEGQAAMQAAWSRAMAAADPLRRSIRETFDAMAAKAGANPELGPVVTALTEARDAALKAIDEALEPSASRAYEAERPKVLPVPTRDAKGRRCRLNALGQLVNATTLEAVEDAGY